MQLPDSVQNILAYGQGYKDGMKDGHILVCAVHDLTGLLKKYHELEQPPEQKHGRWLPTEYDGYADGKPVYDAYECSECGHEHNGEEVTLTAYCPACGAKMDGGDDQDGEDDGSGIGQAFSPD